MNGGEWSVPIPIADCGPEGLIAGLVVRAALAVPLPHDLTEPADVPLASRRLVIHADGGRVVYLVGNYLPDSDQYAIRWPD